MSERRTLDGDGVCEPPRRTNRGKRPYTIESRYLGKPWFPQMAEWGVCRRFSSAKQRDEALKALTKNDNHGFLGGRSWEYRAIDQKVK